jgi:hypothetical protein
MCVVCFLRRGDTSALDPQVVYLAVEVWLLWLQPWNALTILNSSVGTLPSASVAQLSS